MKRSNVWIRHTSAIATAALLGAGALLLAPTAAQAHSEIIGSTPAENATLDAVPTQVALEFNDDVQQEGGAITVTGTDGARYDIDNTFKTSGTEATVDLSDITANGRYTVAYRVVSGDGHVVQGDYAFRVQGITTDDSPSPTPSASDTSSPAAIVTPSTTPASQEEDGGGSVIWVLGLGAIGIALIAAMISVFTRRGRG